MSPPEEHEEPFVLEMPEEAKLSPSEKQIRDRYVAEYLIDYDYVAAAVRCGYGEDVAAEYGRRFFYDPYVQRQVTKGMQAAPHDEDAVEGQERRRIMSSLFREANFKGAGSSHGARVAALAKLSAIHGLEAPTKTEIKHGGKVEAEVTHTVDFEKMTDEQRALARKLLESAVPDGD